MLCRQSLNTLRGMNRFVRCFAEVKWILFNTALFIESQVFIPRQEIKVPLHFIMVREERSMTMFSML